MKVLIIILGIVVALIFAAIGILCYYSPEEKDVVAQLSGALITVLGVILGGIITLIVASWQQKEQTKQQLEQQETQNRQQIEQQKEQDLQQLRIEAWRKISESLKEYKAYLAKIINAKFVRSFRIKSIGPEEFPDNYNISKAYNSLEVFFETFQPPDEWIHALDQYEILLPELADIHKEMTYRFVTIMNKADKIRDELEQMIINNANHGEIFVVFKEVQAFMTLVNLEARIVNDIRALMQNDCLGHLTPNRVTFQVIHGEKVSRLARDKKENWHIANNEAEAIQIQASDTWPPKPAEDEAKPTTPA